MTTDPGPLTDSTGWLRAVLGRLADRDYEGAADLAGAATALYPADARFWELGGLALWAAAAPDDLAVACLEEASLLAPLHPLAMAALGDGFARTGKPALAAAVFDDLATPFGGDRLLAALAGPPGGDWNLVFRAFRAVADHAPANPRGWYGIGVALARLGFPPERVAQPLRQAVRRDPGNPVYRLTLADCHAAGGRPDLGAAELRAVALDGVGCRCWLRAALSVFEAAGDRAAAARCRGRLFDLDPPTPTGSDDAR